MLDGGGTIALAVDSWAWCIDKTRGSLVEEEIISRASVHSQRKRSALYLLSKYDLP